MPKVAGVCFRSDSALTCWQFSFGDIERPDNNVGRLDIRAGEPMALGFVEPLRVGFTETGNLPRANEQVRNKHREEQRESLSTRVV